VVAVAAGEHPYDTPEGRAERELKHITNTLTDLYARLDEVDIPALAQSDREAALLADSHIQLALRALRRFEGR
jgi:hypothetical protein